MFPVLLNYSYAATVRSVCNGNWNSSATWDIGVPGITDVAIVDHYVLLNVDVTINAPGRLIINATGTLCGTHRYKGAFTTYGPMYVSSLLITGSSINNAPIVTLGSVTATGGVWTMNAGVTMGGSFTCASPIPCVAPTTAFDYPKAPICAGELVTFTNQSDYATAYQWQFNGGDIATATIASPTVQYSLPGTYPVTLICTNPYGSDTLTQYITVVALPVLTIPDDTTICKYIPLVLSATGVGDITWQPTSNLSCANCFNPVFDALASQTFTVTLTDNNGCQKSDTLTVSISAPIVNLDELYEVCSDDTLMITLNQVVGYSYLWSDNSTLHYIKVDSTQQVFVMVADSNNCREYDTARVIEKPVTSCNGGCGGQYVPNAFSPNGDGINDKLHVLGDNIILIEFRVYSRYGQLVFNTNNITQSWDGTLNGKQLDAGVFAYFVTGVCKYTNDKIMEKGNVTLIR